MSDFAALYPTYDYYTLTRTLTNPHPNLLPKGEGI